MEVRKLASVRSPREDSVAKKKLPGAPSEVLPQVSKA